MRPLAEAWRRYWFPETPLIDLAVVRVLVVAAQLWILLRRTLRGRLGIPAGLPDELYNPLPVLHLLVAPIDWTFRPSLELIHLINAVTITSGVLALVGWLTNPALVVLATGSIFLQAHDYSFGDFHHPEAPLLIALVVLALSPAGGVLSVDDLRRRMSRNAARLRFEAAGLLRRSSRFAGWPLRLIQWVLALIYFSAAYSKFRFGGGTDWMNGYTLRYYMVEDGLRWGSDLSLWFATQHGLARLLSWATVLFEATFFLAVLFPVLRWAYLPIGCAIHVGVRMTLRANFVPWISLYGAFVPWAAALQRGRAWLLRRAREPARVFFDGACPLCLRSATLLEYLDWGERLDFEAAQTGGRALSTRRADITMDDLMAEMYLIHPDGRAVSGFFAFREIAARLPLLWPLALLARLPGASRLGPHVYRFVARSRARVTPCPDGACRAHVA